MIAAAELVVVAVELYLGTGLVFAVLFAWRGAAAIDPAAKDGTLGFRLLMLPASALLWPLLARRWWRGQGPPVERNAHREAARTTSSAAASPSPQSEAARVETT